MSQNSLLQIGQFMLSHWRVSNQLNKQLLMSSQMEKVVAGGRDSVVYVLEADGALVRDFERHLHKLPVLPISIIFRFKLDKVLVYFLVHCD